MKWISVIILITAILPGYRAGLNAQTAVHVSVFLEGPYDSDIGLMRTELNSLGLLPLQADPFYDSVAVHAIASQDIVDWIQLEFRRGLRSQPALRKTGFLRRDGRIVGLDGGKLFVGAAELPEGEYYVMVRHRNHLDIISAEAVSFFGHGVVSIDFATDPSSAPDERLLTLVDTARKVYGMRAGDVIGDYFFSAADFLQVVNNRDMHGTGYFLEDIDLDGNIMTDDATILARNFGLSFDYFLKTMIILEADTVTVDKAADIRVFPVPVTRGNVFKIGFNRSDVHVKSFIILDSGGRTVYRSADVNQPAGQLFIEVPTQDLIAGLHVVLLNTNRGNSLHKILVSR